MVRVNPQRQTTDPSPLRLSPLLILLVEEAAKKVIHRVCRGRDLGIRLHMGYIVVGREVPRSQSHRKCCCVYSVLAVQGTQRPVLLFGSGTCPLTWSQRSLNFRPSD